jgi:hypothetical protein
MAKGRGLEKMFGTYQDPKQLWRNNNKEHVSNYNQGYFQANKERIYQKRAESRSAERERIF